MSTIIKIEHLHAGYEGKEVLSDINLTVTSDDYLGIIGPNGGGKTTLIRLILGLMKPTSGTIRFFKEEKRKGETRQDKEQKGETNEDKHLKEVKEISMGYLPQYNALDKQFPISVYEVVLSGLSKSKKRKDKILPHSGRICQPQHQYFHQGKPNQGYEYQPIAGRMELGNAGSSSRSARQKDSGWKVGSPIFYKKYKEQ